MSLGTDKTGDHQALVMLPSEAPTSWAKIKPSPLLPGGEAGAFNGPLKKLLTNSSFHSKPPVAIITPLLAKISFFTPPDSISIPVILFFSLISFFVLTFNSGSIPLSRQPLSKAPTRA